MIASFGLAPLLGSNFFPSVDAGQITLHVRAPEGTRIEDTAALFDRVEARSARSSRRGVGDVVDNIGMPISGINRAYSNTGGIGPMDGDIYVTLKDDHRPDRGLRPGAARPCCRASFRRSTFAFLPADIISQILNFGLAGADRPADHAARLSGRTKPMPTFC